MNWLRKAIISALLLPALLAQLCLPVLHHLHEHAIATELAASDLHEHSSDHPTPDSDDQRHDESKCPTCQLFASLRAVAPVSHAPVRITVDLLRLASPQAPATAFVAQFELTQSFPRGPPLG